eukprot:gene27269-33581_t
MEIGVEDYEEEQIVFSDDEEEYEFEISTIPLGSDDMVSQKGGLDASLKNKAKEPPVEAQNDFIALTNEDTAAEPGQQADTIVSSLTESAVIPTDPKHDPNDAPPWIPEGGVRRLYSVRSPLLRLHQEIIDFCRYMEPTDEEKMKRETAVKRVREVALGIWPKASVEIFGSYATGLYLPGSDIDAVILNSGCDNLPNGLKALATALTRRNMAKNVQVITKARVPIIKFVEIESEILFDISFDVRHAFHFAYMTLIGAQAAVWVKSQMESFAQLRPLLLVLKVFLQQRELNEVYTGGFGSYCLLTLLIVHLHNHPSRFKNPKQKLDSNLGGLLLDFLELYGTKLNNGEVGVSGMGGGGFFKKHSKEMFNKERPFLFAVEDPQASGNDIARSSYNCLK